MEEDDKEQNRTKVSKVKMIDALSKTLGIVTPALKEAGVSRTSYYEWLKDDEKFAKDVLVANEISLDHSESQLHKNINDGKERSILFHLERKGRDRGYGARQEIDTNVPLGTGLIMIPDNGRDKLPTEDPDPAPEPEPEKPEDQEDQQDEQPDNPTA